MSKFAETLKSLMLQNNLNTISLKKELNLSTTQSGKYLSGFYDPSLKNLLILCNFFNCSVDYMLGLDNVKRRNLAYSEPSYEKFLDRYNQQIKKNNTNHYRVSINADFDRRTLDYWRNKKTFPTTEILFKICSYFKISADYLLGRIEEEKWN